MKDKFNLRNFLTEGMMDRIPEEKEEVTPQPKGLKDEFLEYGTQEEITQYLDSLSREAKINGEGEYKGWKREDFIEDFRNFVNDKGLGEGDDKVHINSPEDNIYNDSIDAQREKDDEYEPFNEGSEEQEQFEGSEEQEQFEGSEEQRLGEIESEENQIKGAYKEAYELETGLSFDINSFEYDNASKKEVIKIENLISNGEELGDVTLVRNNDGEWRLGF